MIATPTPSRESLQDEFADNCVRLRNAYNTELILCQLIVACAMSEKYKINIHKYLWNVAGIKQGKYQYVLNMMDISYYE